MLRASNVSAGYGRMHVISDVDLTAEPGKITVIVGPNGSGKSTLLRSIAGLITLYNGTVELDGVNLSGLPPHVIAKKGLVYIPQTENAFTRLTVSENFRMAWYTVRKDERAQRLEDALSLFPQLRNYLNSKVNNLSGGERQMVSVVMALIRKPKVIMFDEPTANLSPKYSTEVLDTIQSLAKNTGLTVLLVEQNATRALEVGDTAYLLVGGKKAFEGPCNELLAHPELGRLYLGIKAS
jgi:branched-chain amino acid transport system ATP-binding protein